MKKPGSEMGAPRVPGLLGYSTVGELEKAAGIIDRSAFWMPFAEFGADGLRRGCIELRMLAMKRRERTLIGPLFASAPP